MKRSRAIWNFIDIILQIAATVAIIMGTYVVAEYLERYIYRYTIFPLVSLVLIFILGILVGRGAERTKKNKPIGLVSHLMAKQRKKINTFVFTEKPNSYTPQKEVIEDIKSGDIVHVKQYDNMENMTIDDFKDIYKVEVDDLIDEIFKDNDDNEEKKE